MNGLPVAVVENDVTYYIRTDHIGRPVFATDSAGTKVWEATYLPFGEVLATTGTPIALRFPGQWFQAESGLHQNWMRDYDPTTGRYLQADPLGLVDGASVYGYARQNPGRYVDPTGKYAIVDGIIVGAISGGIGGYISSGGCFDGLLVGAVTGATVGAAIPETISAAVAASAAGQATSSILLPCGCDEGFNIPQNWDEIKNRVKVDPWLAGSSAFGAGLGNGVMRSLWGFSRPGVPPQTLIAVGEGIGAGISESVYNWANYDKTLE